MKINHSIKIFLVFGTVMAGCCFCSNSGYSSEPFGNTATGNTVIENIATLAEPAPPLLGKNVNVYLEGKSQSYPIRDLMYDPSSGEFKKPAVPAVRPPRFGGVSNNLHHLPPLPRTDIRQVSLQTPMNEQRIAAPGFLTMYSEPEFTPLHGTVPTSSPMKLPVLIPPTATDGEPVVTSIPTQVTIPHHVFTLAALPPVAKEEKSSEQTSSPLLGAWKKGSLTITPYGFLNLACVYETYQTATGDFALYVGPPTYDTRTGGTYLANTEPRFLIDVKTTRFGVKIDGPCLGPCSYFDKTTGVIECDFQGGNTMRNRGSVQLRRAFFAVENRDTKLLIGQEWEIVSPLSPFMVNYVPAIGAGNIGYRRAQARIDHTINVCPDTKYLLQAALCDGNPRSMFDTTNVPNGASASWPMIQARLAVSFGERTFSHCKPITVGVSGHVGEERYSFAAITRQYNTGGIPTTVTLREATNDKGILTWSVNGDFDVPLSRRLRLMSEIFVGDNLSSVEGGIMQGVDYFSAQGIRSYGGWVALNTEWNCKWKTNIGYGFDDPLDNDLQLGSNRSAVQGLTRKRNDVYFANVFYNWTANLVTGLEVSYWDTQWRSFYLQDSASPTPPPLSEYMKYDELGSTHSVRCEFQVRYVF